MTFIGIILASLVIAFMTQLVYMTVLRRVFPIKKENFNIDKNSFVSVVIASKNEAAILDNTIEAILDQTYPCFELIIADDFSSDNTFSLVDKYRAQDPRIRYLRVRKNLPGKRQAITEAIAISKGDYILCTDADCISKNSCWISSMVSRAASGHDLVLGIAPFYTKNNWTNRFARYENLMTTLQYIAAVPLGQAYMGVGRNLMYNKSLFKAINGYLGQEHLSSGDDDLLVQKMLPHADIGVVTNPSSFMWSDSEKTLGSFLNQKRRHLSISREYGLKQKLFISIYSSCQLIFYTLWPIAFVCFPIIFTGLMILRWLYQYIILKDIIDLLEYRDLKKWIPLLDIAYFVYLLFFIPTILFAKSNDWNEAPRADR